MFKKSSLVPPEFDLPVTVKVSRRARRMALRLDTATRTVNLVVPERASMNKAWQFAREHEAWIRQKLAELPQPVAFAHDTAIPVLGKDRLIDIRYDADRRTTRIHMDDDRLTVLTNQDDPALRITRYLKQEAKETLSGLARKKSAAIGKTISEIQIRDTKSRWGSCGPDGRISFSWRLIFAPWEAMDYVVAHEVAHLAHLNHGKQFWKLCAELSDDYGRGKRWMRENGHLLLSYGLSEI